MKNIRDKLTELKNKKSTVVVTIIDTVKIKK